MFTGLIERVGRIASLRRNAEGVEMTIDPLGLELALGDSLAVNGVCLTVEGFAGEDVRTSVMPETMQRTNLSGIKPGDRVNLERALTLNKAVGGHLLSGHVDATARVVKITRSGNASVVHVELPQSLADMTAEKGSIAIDGVSLTVVSVSRDTFTVSLVRHTIAATTLTDMKPGRIVNLEADLIARYLKRLLTCESKGTERAQDGPLGTAMIENWLQ